LALALGLAAALGAEVPTFDRFEPRAQAAGAYVEWRGHHLGDVKQVRVAQCSTPCRFQLLEGGRVLGFWIPEEVPPGPRLVSVFYAAPGSAGALKEKVADRPLVVEPAFPIVVDPPAPAGITIETMEPHAGPAGSMVTFTGKGLSQVRIAYFGLTRLEHFEIQNDGLLKVKVPNLPITDCFRFAAGEGGIQGPGSNSSMAHGLRLPSPFRQGGRLDRNPWQ
jgi:hypothetical protein